jgi:hypothetical protein
VPEPKDVIIGILGASGALAGLLLVFSGFIFAQAASFPAEISNKYSAKYTKAGRLALYPFLGFLVTTVGSICWLLFPNPCLFVVCIALFLLLVVWTGVYGAVMSYRYL